MTSALKLLNPNAAGPSHPVRISEQSEGWKGGGALSFCLPGSTGDVSDVAMATKFPSQQRSWKATAGAAAGINTTMGML